MPPPEELTAGPGPFAGLALRTQPDRRLVTLVREGYELAFDEIVRRYGKALGRYAAAIVGGRSEDVTQDAFSKALLALRRNDSEIELRPWLYRIVRNTALNDLRDSPPSTAALTETIAAARTAAEEVERREETAELMDRLRSLPEPQRAAIVMRELEGLSHDEIAAALGVSGGAARQAIFRARQALRGGFGMLIPLPLLKVLIDHGAEAAVGAGASGAAIAGGAASAGGLGAGGAVKIGLATVLVAGAVGTGVAVEQNRDRGGKADGPGTTVSASSEDGATPSTPPPVLTGAVAGAQESEEGSGSGHRRGEAEPGDDRNEGQSSGPGRGDDAPGADDSGPGSLSGRKGHGPRGGHSPPGGPPRHGGPGPGDDRGNGGPRSGGHGGPAGSGGRSGSGSSGEPGSGGGHGSQEGGGPRGESGSGGHGGPGPGGPGGGAGGSGDGDQEPPTAEPIPSEELPEGSEGPGDGGESGSDRDGSESS